MRRTDKIKALTDFLQGDTHTLRRLGRPQNRTRNLDEMSDEELNALIEAETGQPAPDFSTWSDEELDAFVNGTYPYEAS